MNRLSIISYYKWKILFWGILFSLIGAAMVYGPEYGINQRIVVLRFADEEGFYGWYESEAYKAIKPIRLNASHGEVHLLQELNLRF